MKKCFDFIKRYDCRIVIQIGVDSTRNQQQFLVIALQLLKGILAEIGGFQPPLEFSERAW